MEPYKLDVSLDANKVFVVKRSELENRIDPIFYGSDLTKFNKKFTSVKFSSVVSLFKSGVGAGKQDQAEGDEGIIQIRPTNIDNFGNLKFDKNVFLPYGFKGDKLKVDDVLFNNTNSQELVGKTAILLEEKELFYSNHITRIVVDKSQVLPLYIWIILNIYQENKIFYALCTNWNNQSGVGLELLKSLPIPLPPIEIQENIVSIIQNAYTQKQAKEAESKDLLASIDTYLLNELGITLPEKDNSLEARIFTTNFSEVVGGRLDPFGIISQKLKIEGGLYENFPLKKLAVLQKGQSITSDKIIEGDYPVIAGGQSSPYNHNVYNHKGNVITVSASGAYSGYVWYHHTPIFASDCTMIYSKDETSITTLFLSEILKCKQSEIYSLQQGAGQPHVYARDLEKLQIPLPPLEKQNEIAEYIASIRANAKALQQEAEQILAEAKQKVEQIILGHD